MSLIIPDLIICNTLNNALRALRLDYKSNVSAGTVNRSMLYLLFNGLSLGKYMVFDSAVGIINTTPENPRHFDVKLSFDKGAKPFPFVIVDCPSETDKNNSIGIGQGDNDELVFQNEDGLDVYRSQFTRRYASTYNIIVGSDNKNETIILYHLFKSILTFSLNHLIYLGLNVPRIGGGNLSFSDRLPDGTFAKSITINFEYEQVTPEFQLNEIINKLILAWQFEGADEPEGIVEIDVESGESS